MDSQHLFDGILAVALTVVGYFAKALHLKIEKLENDHAHLHEVYVKRDDFKDSTNRIFSILERIENKLDSKADR